MENNFFMIAPPFSSPLITTNGYPWVADGSFQAVGYAQNENKFYKYDYNYQLLSIYLYLLYIFGVAMSIAPCTTILKVFRISYKIMR